MPGFRWHNGAMTALSTLGGNNSFAKGVNNRGQVVGGAETSTKGTAAGQPQLFVYYGVIWQPNRTTLTLPPYAGDTVSFANAISNSGDAAGDSGSGTPRLSRSRRTRYSGSAAPRSTSATSAAPRTMSRLPSIIGVRSSRRQRSRKHNVACLPVAERHNGRSRNAARGCLAARQGINDKGQIVGGRARTETAAHSSGKTAR